MFCHFVETFECDLDDGDGTGRFGGIAQFEVEDLNRFPQYFPNTLHLTIFTIQTDLDRQSLQRYFQNHGEFEKGQHNKDLIKKCIFRKYITHVPIYQILQDLFLDALALLNLYCSLTVFLFIAKITSISENKLALFQYMRQKLKVQSPCKTSVDLVSSQQIF